MASGSTRETTEPSGNLVPEDTLSLPNLDDQITARREPPLPESDITR
jgi:hypothetical protein